MDTTTSIWDRYADGYARRKVSNQDAYEQKLTESQALFRPDMELFEFGCGTGSTALRHAPHVKHILATDISARMLDIARGKAMTQGLDNVSFVQGAIDDLNLDDDCFDIVMAHSILHLLPNHKRALEKSWSFLKPGGYFISSTICLQDKMSWLKPVLALGRMFGFLPKVHFLSSNGLLDDIRQQGFQIERQWQPSKSEALFVIARKPA